MLTIKNNYIMTQTNNTIHDLLSTTIGDNKLKEFQMASSLVSYLEEKYPNEKTRNCILGFIKQIKGGKSYIEYIQNLSKEDRDIISSFLNEIDKDTNNQPNNTKESLNKASLKSVLQLILKDIRTGENLQKKINTLLERDEYKSERVSLCGYIQKVEQGEITADNYRSAISSDKDLKAFESFITSLANEYKIVNVEDVLLQIYLNHFKVNNALSGEPTKAQKKFVDLVKNGSITAENFENSSELTDDDKKEINEYLNKVFQKEPILKKAFKQYNEVEKYFENYSNENFSDDERKTIDKIIAETDKLVTDIESSKNDQKQKETKKANAFTDYILRLNDKERTVLDKYINYRKSKTRWNRFCSFFKSKRKTTNNQPSTPERLEKFDDFLKNRYQGQRTYFSKTAGKAKDRFYNNQKQVLWLTVTIPVVVAIGTILIQIPDEAKCIKILSYIISCITILLSSMVAYRTSKDKLEDNQTDWRKYREVSEKLKQEFSHFEGKCGPYTNCKSDEERQIMFRERVELCIEAEVSRFSSLNIDTDKLSSETRNLLEAYRKAYPNFKPPQD